MATGAARNARDHRRSGDQEKTKQIFSSCFLTSFYEAVGCQAPAVFPAFERAPAGAGSSQAGSPRRRRRDHRARVRTYRLAPSHTGRSVRSQASPDHLLSVVTRGHTPAAHMRWTEGRAAPSVRRFPKEPGGQASGAHQCGRRARARARSLASSVSGARPRASRPWSTNRHNAITSLRATATIPMRRLRPPAAANRRVNHAASALSGCQRSQHHASWMLTRRSSPRPALLIPWSCTR